MGVGVSGRGDGWQFGLFLSLGISVPLNALVWECTGLATGDDVPLSFYLEISIPDKTTYNQL